MRESAERAVALPIVDVREEGRRRRKGASFFYNIVSGTVAVCRSLLRRIQWVGLGRFPAPGKQFFTIFGQWMRHNESTIKNQFWIDSAIQNSTILGIDLTLLREAFPAVGRSVRSKLRAIFVKRRLSPLEIRPLEVFSEKMVKIAFAPHVASRC